MNTIAITNFTKDYGNGKGVFDVTITIKQGEVYGYLGPNGAGKSTTMRHLIGFEKPHFGTVCIEHMDCWKEQPKIQEKVGYLPGEIRLPETMSGLAYIKLIAQMKKMNDLSYAKKLLDVFEINPNLPIKKMSKGMKQKIGIVSAFMNDPAILLLDEPTSGLDPCMQKRFIELMKQEKARGKTILLSTHVFDEVEKTCDIVGMIKDGILIQQISIDEMRRLQRKTYTVVFLDTPSMQIAMQAYPNAECYKAQKQMTVSITDTDINHFIFVLSKCKIAFLREEKHTLEEYFMKYYGGNHHD